MYICIHDYIIANNRWIIKQKVCKWEGLFYFFWLILKGPRPKLSLNSPRNCWQGGKEVWWVVCVCVQVGFLLFLESISYLFIKYMSGKYLSNKCHKYMYVLKKDGRPESAKHWKNVYTYIYIYIWILFD